jgi:hypothetical protein
LLPPVFLDYYLNDSGGYDVPRLPYLRDVIRLTIPNGSSGLRVQPEL